MAITYAYKITQLKKVDSLDKLKDVIIHVRFEYTGTDEKGNSHTFQGAVPMPAPTKSDFTPIADLTEDQVIEWVKAHHPIAHMQEVIQAEIAKQKNVESEIDLPWAPPKEETPVEEVPIDPLPAV